MTLHVLTARIGARDPDVLDITRKSSTGDGLAFAPSWALLTPIVSVRQHIDLLRRNAENADKIGHAMTARDIRRRAREDETKLRDAWPEYAAAYTAEMRASYAGDGKRAFLALLARERVCLVCYCVDADFCHRTILARDILPKLGAVYVGEAKTEATQGALFR